MVIIRRKDAKRWKNDYLVKGVSLPPLAYNGSQPYAVGAFNHCTTLKAQNDD